MSDSDSSASIPTRISSRSRAVSTAPAMLELPTVCCSGGPGHHDRSVAATVGIRRASINVRYEARADISNGFDGVVAYSAPVFTTSHSGYLWLNLIQTVGRVTIQGNHI